MYTLRLVPNRKIIHWQDENVWFEFQMKLMLGEWDSRCEGHKSHSHVDRIMGKFLEWAEQFLRQKWLENLLI